MQINTRTDRLGSSGEKHAFSFEADKRHLAQGGFVVLEAKYWGTVTVADGLSCRKRSDLLQLIDHGVMAGELQQDVTTGRVTVSSKQVKVHYGNQDEYPAERILLNDLIAASFVRDDADCLVVFTFCSRSSDSVHQSAVVSVSGRETAERLCELVQFVFELAFGLRSGSSEEKRPLGTPASTLDRRSMASERPKVPETPPSQHSGKLRLSAVTETFQSSESLAKSALAERGKQRGGSKKSAKPGKKGTSVLLNFKNAFSKKRKSAGPTQLPLTPAASNSNVSKSELDYRVCAEAPEQPSVAPPSAAVPVREPPEPISVEIPDNDTDSEPMPLASPSLSPSVANRTIRSTNSALSYATSEALQHYIRMLATRLNIVQLKRFSGLLSSFVSSRMKFEDFCDSLNELYGEYRKQLFPGLRPFVPDEYVPYFENFLMTKCGIVPNFVESTDMYRTFTNGTISSESSTLTMGSRSAYNRSISYQSNVLQSAFGQANDETSSIVVQEFDRILSELDDSLQSKPSSSEQRPHLDPQEPTAAFAAHNYAVELQNNYGRTRSAGLAGDRPKFYPAAKPSRVAAYPVLRAQGARESREYRDNMRSLNGARSTLSLHVAPSKAQMHSGGQSTSSLSSRSTSTSQSAEQSPLGSPNNPRKEVFINIGAVAFPPYRNIASESYYRQFRGGGPLKPKAS